MKAMEGRWQEGDCVAKKRKLVSIFFKRQVRGSTVRQSSVSPGPQGWGHTIPHVGETACIVPFCEFHHLNGVVGIGGGGNLHSWSREQIFSQWVQTVLLQFRLLSQRTALPSTLIWQLSKRFQGLPGPMGGLSFAVLVISVGTARSIPGPRVSSCQVFSWTNRGSAVMTSHVTSHGVRRSSLPKCAVSCTGPWTATPFRVRSCSYLGWELTPSWAQTPLSEALGCLCEMRDLFVLQFISCLPK